MQNYLSRTNDRGSAQVYLEYDFHFLFTNPKISILRLDFKDLLFEQFFPTKPGTHVQLKSFTPSVHVPLFRHGFGKQSSVSEGKVKIN